MWGMSIQVTGNSRPGKPVLAITVSGLLLVGTVLGAAALTHVRNRPVPLKPAQDMQAVRGLRMAWPQDWPPAQLPPRTGPVVFGVTQPSASGSKERALFLLAERVGDSYVSPQYAATHVLQSAARQLGLQIAPGDLVASPAQLAGRPAVQIEYRVELRRQAFWAALRVAGEPNGMAIGLLLLSGEQMSPAAKRILDGVADSMHLRRSSVDVAAALGSLKLSAHSSDGALASLRGYLQELPVAGPIGVTFVPEGPSGGQPYAIDVWTSWLANRRTLQDMAGTWFRRMYLLLDPPGDSGWVQRSGTRIWKMALAERHDGRNSLVETLYLKELPDRRVVWAHTVADVDANPEDTVLDLLAAIQPLEKTGWDYDTAVTSAATTLAAVAGEPVNAYYRANLGAQEFVFTGVNGQQNGSGLYTTAIQDDGTLARNEQVDIGPNSEILQSKRTSLLRADLSTFQVKDTTIHMQDSSLRTSSGRTDAASPVTIRMQFGRTAPIEASFLTREPFLPDPAIEPAALYLAHKPGAAALFRTVGSDPEVPESVLLTGRGRQHFEVAGRRIDAFVCVIQEDTNNGPSLALFDEQAKLIGYVLQGGATFLRTVAAVASEPAAASD